MDVYLPNVYRTNNLLKCENGKTVASVPYAMDLDYSNDEHLKIIMLYAESKIIENILMFDTVYLDAIDLPIFLGDMIKRDNNLINDLLEMGCISFVNMDQIIIATYENQGNYNLACMGGKIKHFNNEQELQEFITSYSNDISLNCKEIYMQSKNIIDTHEIGKKLVHKIDNDLKAGIFNEFGIGIMGNYGISKDNRSIFDAISQVELSMKIASQVGIDIIAVEDYLNTIYQCCNIHNNRNIHSKYNKLIKLSACPDIGMLYFEGKMTIKDVLKLKRNNKFKSLINWLNQTSIQDVEKEFMKLLGNKSLYSYKFTKGLRFFIVNGLGVLNTGLGLGCSIGDSIIESSLEKNDALQGIERLNKYNKKTNANQGDERYEIPVKTEIVVDSTMEHNMNVETYLVECINEYAKKIIETQSLFDAYRCFENAKEKMNEMCTENTVIAYSSCMINLSDRDKNNCNNWIVQYKDMLNFIESVVSKDGYKKMSQNYAKIIINGIVKYSLDEVCIVNLKMLKNSDYVLTSILNAVKELSCTNDKMARRLIAIIMYIKGEADAIIPDSEVEYVIDGNILYYKLAKPQFCPLNTLSFSELEEIKVQIMGNLLENNNEKDTQELIQELKEIYRINDYKWEI